MKNECGHCALHVCICQKVAVLKISDYEVNMKSIIIYNNIFIGIVSVS